MTPSERRNGDLAGHLRLPDLDDLVAEVDRSCVGATAPGSVEPDWLALLRAAAGVAARLRVLGDDLVEEYVEHCRLQGESYEAIGAALAVAGEGAASRIVTPQAAYLPEEIAPELRAAMHAMKAEAVRHSNNFVGTEHLLGGLLRSDNSATALLQRSEIDLELLARDVERSFVRGASAPSARIAWTPYARRALAMAKADAQRGGGGPIGCAHVLVALAGLGAGVAARVLAANGADAAVLRRGGGGSG